jgi:argininosuccinate lyase
MSRLWDKGKPLDEQVLAYTAGDDYVLDNRLVEYDIRASVAHAEMLGEQGLLSDGDLAAIRDALTGIGEDHARGSWRVTLDQEDCQTAIENLLTERIGATGGRLHAGRSRNDQVLAALRLYLREAVRELHAGALAVADALDALAARQGSVVLPGYTHMQQAMPSTVALWAAGFAAEIRDDAEGLAQAERRIDKNPLGSAAGYGTPNLKISREATGQRLGFAVTHEPVTAVQLSRGKAEAHVLFELTLLTQDMGRLAADLLLFYTQEYGFVALPAEFTTGSSIMPQKRNPDVFELMRGRSAVAQAALNEVLQITQKLSSGYHRDLQLIKPPLFRGIDSCRQTLGILPSALAGVRFKPEAIHLDPSIHAAAEANALVMAENIPFREAYRRVGAQLERGATRGGSAEWGDGAERGAGAALGGGASLGSVASPEDRE